jgi:hypothetical protein
VRFLSVSVQSTTRGTLGQPGQSLGVTGDAWPVPAMLARYVGHDVDAR